MNAPKYFKLLLTGLALLVMTPLVAQDALNGLRHWEIPSKDPDRIILTFNGDPATSRAVTWRTDVIITDAVAQIAEATVNSGFMANVTTINATTEVFDLGMYKGNVPLKVHYHSALHSKGTKRTHFSNLSRQHLLQLFKASP